MDAETEKEEPISLAETDSPPLSSKALAAGRKKLEKSRLQLPLAAVGIATCDLSRFGCDWAVSSTSLTADSGTHSVGCVPSTLCSAAFSGLPADSEPTSDLSSSCLTLTGEGTTSLHPYLKPSPPISRFDDWNMHMRQNDLVCWVWKQSLIFLLYSLTPSVAIRLEFVVTYTTLKNKLEFLFLIEWKH